MKFIKTISLLALIFSSDLYSHPHLSVSYDILFLFDKEGVSGIKMHWDMDPMFSASLIESFDKNNNKRFEKNEIKTLHDEAFLNLENYHYMTYVHLDGKSEKFFPATDFHASISDSMVRYTFTLPLNIKAKERKKELIVSVFDESFFMYMSFTEKLEAEISSNNTIKYSLHIDKKTEKNIYDVDEIKKTSVLTFSKNTDKEVK